MEKLFRLGWALLCVAGLLAAAPAFECEFVCDAPGAANQSLCAPVAGTLQLIWQPALETATVKFFGFNGTLISGVTLWFDGLPVWHTAASIHSNGGSASWMIAGAGDLLGGQVEVVGLGGADEVKTFTAFCCADDPAPAPDVGTMSVGVGMALLWWRRRG